jgi:hypothetical protein
MRPPSLRPSAELAANKAHGTRVKYLGGCRCVPCRAANSRYSCERDRANKNFETDHIVSADIAREHLQLLSSKGVGRRAVADASGVARTIISGIRRGTRKHLRESTERRILAVDCDARSDSSYVPAAPVWKQIEELLQEGYTRRWIAQRLGFKSPALQFRKDQVLARTALRVKKLYEAITGDEWRAA